MKRVSWVTFIGVLVVTVSVNGAATYCSPATTTTLATVGSSGSTTIQCGQLILSGFWVADSGGTPSAQLTYVVNTVFILNGSYYDPATGLVAIAINPNPTNSSVIQDIHLGFNVNVSPGWAAAIEVLRQSRVSRPLCVLALGRLLLLAHVRVDQW